MSSSKKITLKSSDGELFNVEETVALQSKTIDLWREDHDINGDFHLPQVTGKIVAKVIEYCKKHVYAAAEDNLKSWDADFVVVDNETLFELMKAANYLNIASLLDLTCQTMADLIAEKPPEEIRTIFNIKNDYTPEEEEEIRKKNAWAYE